MKPALHRLHSLPNGKTIGDVLPAFSDIKTEFHIGEPNKECAACRKPFNAVRKVRETIRIWPCPGLPIACDYRVCGACLAMHRRGGASSDAFLAAIEAYHDGIDLEGLS